MSILVGDESTPATPGGSKSEIFADVSVQPSIIKVKHDDGTVVSLEASGGAEVNNLVSDGIAGITNNQAIVGTSEGKGTYLDLPQGALEYDLTGRTFHVAGLTSLSDVASITGTGTTALLNSSPTIVTPTIASFTNATHDHEDAAGGNTLASTATPTAIHDDTASEISAVTLKASPVSGDFLLIEDSAAANAKKRITIGTLPAGSEVNDLATDGINGITNNQVVVGDSAGLGTYLDLPEGALAYTLSGRTFSIAGLTDLNDVTAITGTGSTALLNSSPTIITPTIASFTNATHDHQDAAGGGTLSHNSATDNPITETHGISGSVVGTTDTQTLTNKTLTTPTIASFTNATHDHEDAAGGNTLASAATPTAIHDDVASEISAVTLKASPVSGDFLLIEDSAAANAKKRVTIGTLPTGSDADAIHDNVASEISAITNKATPVGGDFLLIEDSADSNNKKHILVSSLPSGSGDAVSVNSSAATDADFDDDTPASPLGSENVLWQSSGASPTSVSAYPQPTHFRALMLMGG